MTVKVFQKINTHIHAIKFEGGPESGAKVCKFVGAGSSYIPSTKTDPFDYITIPTVFGPRTLEEGEWIAKIEERSYLNFKEEALFSEYQEVTDEDSYLVKHARIELSGFPEEDPEFVEHIMDTVKAFSKYKGHGGGSVAIAIHMISALLNGQNLLPLTDDPEEWEHHDAKKYGIEQDYWQNKRNSSALSMDGGKTYFLVDEKREPGADPKFYTSQDKDYKPAIAEEDLEGDKHD